MNFKNAIAPLFMATAIFFGCQESGPKATKEVDPAEVSRLNEWFEKTFERNLMDSPKLLSTLGRKDRQSELNDLSEAHRLEKLEQAKKDLAALLKFDQNKLDAQSDLSFRLYKRKLERQIEYAKYAHYDYPVNQMFGLQSAFPSFMVSIHTVDTKEDALAYIDRLHAVKLQFNQLIDNLKIREEKGIIPPKFVFGHVLSDCHNVIGDTNNMEANLFIEDLRSKLKDLELSDKEEEEMMTNAKVAVKESVVVAYKKLVDYLNVLEQKATTDDGAWKFKDGENFYKYRLQEMTTTSLSADEIFAIGNAEVQRIHKEMEEVMQKVQFEGSLQEFFRFMKEDQRFYYESGEEGRAKALAKYQAIVDSMEMVLDEAFNIKPKARMQVKAVEAWREKSAGLAFYQEGTPDGSRKGTFYANLYRSSDLPTYEMEALAYHEGIPGHHMQISIAQELTDIPKFRMYDNYNAYVEGWGLYSELLPKEMGFYKDPYSDFGRLSLELWRACRLVVDVGVHKKRWTREEAIQFLTDNTPGSIGICTKAIERYIVMPGQATSYKIGMRHILKMREKARLALKDKFDIKKFHDIFLRSGAVPLDFFEEEIDRWISSEQME